MFISKFFVGILFVAAAHAAAIGQGLKRGSDAESVSLSQPDAPIDDATVHAEVLNLVTGLLGGLLGGGGLGLRSVTDDTAIDQGLKRSSAAEGLSLRQLDDSIDTPIEDAAVDAQSLGSVIKNLGKKLLPKIIGALPNIVKGVAKAIPKIADGVVDSPGDGPGGSDLAT